jgi:aspartate kinase
MIVMKFGGSSFQDAAAWQRVLAIVQARKSLGPLVVVSAIAGITNTLAAAAANAARGEGMKVQQNFEQIAAAHFDACEVLGLGKELQQQIGARIRDLRMCLQSVLTLGELTPRIRDQVLGYGELLSSSIAAEFLKQNGLPARFVDAREFLITNDTFGSAIPRFRSSRIRAQNLLAPLLQQNIIAVVPGFIGATEKGFTSTLGRGGSDYSASLLGGWLGAEEIEIWKDVPGFMTADPMVVTDAQTIPYLSYSDAEQLCRFGAKILHPLAVRYAARKGLALCILYTRDPANPGTLITAKRIHSPHVIGIAAHIASGRVTVIGEGLRKPMVAAQILNSCGGVEILRVSQNSLRSRMILVIMKEDTERAIRQIHDGVKSYL